PCEACCRELFDPSNRRYRYPFLNCTDCGPRLTIVRGVPYDRERTTMASFLMCEGCRAEYHDASNRRFHAQPNACPDCGPKLTAFDADARKLDVEDSLAVFVQAISGGAIGALKSLGGYHLVCDARNDAAVRELRQRKHRAEQPFAVMVADIEAARRLCHCNEHEARLLLSPARPIVLLRQRQETLVGQEMRLPGPPGPVTDYGDQAHGDQARLMQQIQLSNSVAPGNPDLGVMLPSTPLHHLLLRDLGNIPLVLTSGNRSDEPIACQEEDAFTRLRGIADLFLTHDRPIHVRCDDSVMRIAAAQEMPLRRSRGYAPGSLRLPHPCSRPTLAVGGQLKNTFALAHGVDAVVSHHLGDLTDLLAYQAFERDMQLYEQLFDLRPEVIVHDLHPDYLSTRFARRRAADEGIALLPMQHHHAHMASCMAEHRLSGPVIGVTLDGTGFGTDGAVWGGEFLIGDYNHFTRAGQLRYVRMPGGERAVREPWRMALSHLFDANCSGSAAHLRASTDQLHTAQRLLENGFNSPQTSSAGRLFDAVAALLTGRECVSYEGQAAMELEWLAGRSRESAAYPFELEMNERIVVDTRPVIRSIVADLQRGTERSAIARRFHNSLIDIIAAVCDQLRETHGIAVVVLTGGVFQNVLLVRGVQRRLLRREFVVYTHQTVPANDGGLSLGQLAMAAANG
ncbi:MAG: carbamoyltransferase HypF, partial [Planctomycetaceae bacterium]|nr:carbamoyltransferase HypF [Planctomycetaceae bacterium]